MQSKLKVIHQRIASPLFEFLYLSLQFSNESLQLRLLLVLLSALLHPVLQLVGVGLAELRDLRPVDIDCQTRGAWLLLGDLQVMNSVDVFTEQIIEFFETEKPSWEVILSILKGHSRQGGHGGRLVCFLRLGRGWRGQLRGRPGQGVPGVRLARLAGHLCGGGQGGAGVKAGDVSLSFYRNQAGGNLINTVCTVINALNLGTFTR